MARPVYGLLMLPGVAFDFLLTRSGLGAVATAIADIVAKQSLSIKRAHEPVIGKFKLCR